MHPQDGRVISNFIVQALQGEDLTVYGNGEQTRSFCYVDDLIAGLIALMQSPDGVVGPVNIGNPDEYTILELAEMVLHIIGGRSKIVFKPLPQDDPTQRQPDITVARTTLGWEPKVPLQEGLERTIMYFRTLLQTDNGA
jgi:UDP-glucuronate decarboxylase